MTFPGDIRTLLFNSCLALIDERIAAAQQYLDGISESVNDETKSSAGDKHETGRAMAQIEQEKAARQLNDAIKMKTELQRIDLSKSGDTIVPGSVVITDKQHFFISVPAGAIIASGKSFYAVSPVSPIGKALMGKKAGEKLELNGNSFSIEKLL
jgi:hypothetical protein